MTENVIAEAAELSACRLHDRVLRWSRLVSSHRLRLPAITIEQRFGLPSLTAVDAGAASLAPAFNSALTAIPSSVQVTRGAYVYDRRSQQYSQQVQLTNAGTTPGPAPLLLALDGLSANATLFNPAGTTVNIAPLGSPYVSLPVGGTVLAPGQTVSVTLVFVNPTRGAINYTARVLAGTPAP